MASSTADQSPRLSYVEQLLGPNSAQAQGAAAQGREPNGLWDAIGHIIDLLTPSECANYFAAVGCEPD